MNVETNGAPLLHVTDTNVSPRSKQTIAVLAGTSDKAVPVVRFTIGGEHVTSK